jgi:hypothetical protein
MAPAQVSASPGPSMQQLQGHWTVLDKLIGMVLSTDRPAGLQYPCKPCLHDQALVQGNQVAAAQQLLPVGRTVTRVC